MTSEKLLNAFTWIDSSQKKLAWLDSNQTKMNRFQASNFDFVTVLSWGVTNKPISKKSLGVLFSINEKLVKISIQKISVAHSLYGLMTTANIVWPSMMHSKNKATNTTVNAWSVIIDLTLSGGIIYHLSASIEVSLDVSTDLHLFES